MITITTKPAEEGTAKVVAGPFTDESGTQRTPTAFTWTLTDRHGNVINEREEVSATPGATVTWLLTGDDLAITDGDTRRIITIAATYNSTLGNGLVLREQAKFDIEDLVAIS